MVENSDCLCLMWTADSEWEAGDREAGCSLVVVVMVVVVGSNSLGWGYLKAAPNISLGWPWKGRKNELLSLLTPITFPSLLSIQSCKWPWTPWKSRGLRAKSSIMFSSIATVFTAYALSFVLWGWTTLEKLQPFLQSGILVLLSLGWRFLVLPHDR